MWLAVNRRDRGRASNGEEYPYHRGRKGHQTPKGRYLFKGHSVALDEEVLVGEVRYPLRKLWNTTRKVLGRYGLRGALAPVDVPTASRLASSDQ